MKTLFLPILAALTFTTTNSAFALNICSMTFNSSNERETFKKIYPGSVHELVPDDKNPNWLKDQCKSGIKCDVLLISGHFGGTFFGEKSSQILALHDLEDLSCQHSCDSILGAKQVYLMGCNTLADKTPDHRSIDTYLKVLVQDGFPRSIAEDVVASRYANFGLSMAERMSLAFNHSESLYGFSSTGPLGALAAPLLREAVTRNASVQELDQALKSAFSGTSFRVVHPQNEIQSETQRLSCKLRSKDTSTREAGYEQALTQAPLSKYFDLFLNHSDDSALKRAFELLPSARDKLESLAQSISEKSEVLIGIGVKVLKLRHELQLISDQEYKSKLEIMIESRLKLGLDYISLDQLCDIAQSDLSLSFQSNYLNYASYSNRSYYEHLAGCFNHVSQDALSTLKDWAVQSNDDSTRREGLITLASRWSPSEMNTLQQMALNWGARDRLELQLSLKQKVAVEDPQWNQTLNEARGLSGNARDSILWRSFPSLIHRVRNLSACLSAASEFQTFDSLGTHWNCYDAFPQEISVLALIQSAQKYSRLEPSHNPEKADDFILGGFQRLREQHAVNRSQCLTLTNALQIPGNKIKQNWNCMNQI